MVVVVYLLVIFPIILVKVLGKVISFFIIFNVFHNDFHQNRNGDYMESMNSFKRNGSILDGRSAHTEISAKSRQISPPDGASALMNPPHSPPYSERYSSAAAAVVAAANAKAHDPNNDWYVSGGD